MTIYNVHKELIGKLFAIILPALFSSKKSLTATIAELESELDRLRHENVDLKERLVSLERKEKLHSAGRDVTRFCKLLLIGMLIPIAGGLLLASLIDRNFANRVLAYSLIR